MRIDSSFNQYQGVAPQQSVNQPRDRDGNMKDLANILQAASIQRSGITLKLAKIAAQDMAKFTGLGQNFDQYA
jgi:hypothetical protein